MELKTVREALKESAKILKISHAINEGLRQNRGCGITITGKSQVFFFRQMVKQTGDVKRIFEQLKDILCSVAGDEDEEAESIEDKYPTLPMSD